MSENKFMKMVRECINSPISADTDEYPVFFDDGVDFMGTGITIGKFGEIMGSCSEGLLNLCEQNPAIKLVIWDCIRRLLMGDMGDGGELAKKAKVNFHEGMPFRCVYETPMVSENEIVFGVEEEGHLENPRSIYALLPSEEQLIQEWYDRHPEERHTMRTPYVLFLDLH